MVISKNIIAPIVIGIILIILIAFIYFYLVMANLKRGLTKSQNTFNSHISPKSGYELEYSPLKWNLPFIRKVHNCYDYAFNNYDIWQSPKSQPGEFSNYEIDDFTCPNVTKALEKDHSEIYPTELENECKKGYYKIALMVDPGKDFHFMRQDSNGYWSHKPGTLSVRNIDESGELITDPANANNDSGEFNYTDFCNYYCISRNSHNNL